MLFERLSKMEDRHAFETQMLDWKVSSFPNDVLLTHQKTMKMSKGQLR